MSRHTKHSATFYFFVLTLSRHVVMVVMVNVFGVTGNKSNCCSLGDLMTQYIVGMNQSSS